MRERSQKDKSECLSSGLLGVLCSTSAFSAFKDSGLATDD